MHTSTRRVAAIGIALVIGAAALTACSGTSEPGGDQSLEVAFWNWGTPAETQNRATADAFEAANPGVTVDLTPIAGDNWGGYLANLATLLASGEKPDLVHVASEAARFVVANELVVPIDEYLANDPEAEALLDDIAPNLVEGFTIDGNVLALPFAWNNMVIYYNTDVFAEAGVAVPTADWSWEEFRETAAALSKDTDGDGTNDAYGFTWASNEIFPGILPWVANSGGNLVSDDVCSATADSPEVTEAVEFLNGLIADGIAPAPMPMGDVFTRFQNGQVAMFGAGRWPITSFVPAGFTAFDIQLYPTGDTYRTVAGAGAYPILTTSDNPDLAWEYQKFTVSEEIQQQYVGTPEAPGDGIPALRSVAQKIVDDGVPPSNSALYYGSIDDHPGLVPFPAPQKYSEYESAVLRHLQLIFAGETSVADGLAAMQADLDSVVTC